MKNLLISLSFLALFNCKKTEAFEDKSSVSAMMVAPNEEVDANIVMTDSAAVAMEEPPQNEEPTSPKKIDSISKKIIKNGEMSIQVGNIKTAQNQVNEILKKNNAYVQDESFRNSERDENLDLTIRVPNKNFDNLTNSFSDGIGEVTFKRISANDVTEEYTDVSIKLANKKIYLEKYRDLLKKAGSTKEMLEIQEKIRVLEDEIDVSEGRLRYIDDKVNYSTLNLTLSKEKPRTSVTSKIGFGSRFVDSIAEGWNGFVSFFLGIISLWPFFLLIPVIIYGFKRWKKWKKSKKS